jgi:hypothetical protein
LIGGFRRPHDLGAYADYTVVVVVKLIKIEAQDGLSERREMDQV